MTMTHVLYNHATIQQYVSDGFIHQRGNFALSFINIFYIFWQANCLIVIFNAKTQRSLLTLLYPEYFSFLWLI